MLDLEELLNKIKSASADENGNIILPKEYLKKFIITNILINNEKIKVPKDSIFDYLEGEDFILPSSYDTIEDSKKKKYLNTLEALIKLFYLS